MKITQKIEQAKKEKRTWWSFEYFPPRTAQVRRFIIHIPHLPLTAVDRVYKTSLIVSNVCDFSAQSSLTLHGVYPPTIRHVCAQTCIHTFFRHSGGRTSQLTTEMIKFCQGTIGLETCMHLTCTNMQPEKIDIALAVRSYNNSIAVQTMNRILFI